MGITQKQIAEKLNVSRSLVGRALNGDIEVALETRQRITDEAQKMGYDVRTNQAARSLIAKRYGQRLNHGVIAVLFPMEDTPSPRSIPFFAPFLEGMEAEAARLGVDICLCLIRPWELPRMVREGNVDGVVFTAFPENAFQCVRDISVPLVLFQAILPEIHSMSADDREAARLATRHLLELGHRRIAFLGVGNGRVGPHRADWLRLQGYLDALNEFGIAICEEWIDTSLDLPPATDHDNYNGCHTCAACQGWAALKAKSGAVAGKALPFTAVVCHSDLVAMGLIRQAKQDGVKVPQELSVTGFDDVSAEYHFHPRITSVRFPNYDMGRAAVRLIHEEAHKSSKEKSETEHRVFPPTLSIHQSTLAPQDQTT
jgi:DNA-binding LacI/PurR family transcriptional regulator